MNNYWKRCKVGALLIACCLPLILAGCGGGDGGGGPAMTTISGVATKGPIKGGTVSVYKIVNGQKGDKLAETTTGVDGFYQMQIPANSGAVLVEVVGGAGVTYKDEVTGLDVPFTAAMKFRTAVPDSATDQTIEITPLTEMAVQVMESNGALSTDNIRSSNILIASVFGLTDIVGTKPADVVSGAGGTDAEKQYGLVLATISQMVKDQIATNPSITAPQVTAQIATELFTKGKLEITGPQFIQALGTIVAVINAANPTAPLPPSVIADISVPVNQAITTPVVSPDLSDTTPPTAPINLSLVTRDFNSVKIAWDAATDNVAVVGYDVYRDGLLIATVSQPTYTDGTVAPNTTYSYKVQAFDRALNKSAFSSDLSVTTPINNLGVNVSGQLSDGILGLPQTDIISPAAPINLSATTSAISATNSSVLLVWSPATDNVAVIGYDVYRNGSKIATVAVPGYTDPTVASNVTYTYYVKALDAAGNRSLASNQLPVTPPPAILGVTVNGQLSL